MIELPLVTSRLVIDRLSPKDAGVVVSYRNDPETARFQSWPLPYTLRLAEQLAAGGQLGLRAGEELVGDAMVEPVCAGGHDVEIGITLAPAWRGGGLASEAVTALTDASFRSGGVRVIARVDTRNAASLGLFDRLGFRREGHSHHGFRGRDGLVDEVLFGLTADVWRQPTTQLTAEVDPHPADVARLEAALYEFNAEAVGRDDGAELAIFERDRLGRIVAGAAGVVWAGSAELRQLWVQADRRGAGLGRRLLAAFEEGARARGARKIFVSTHSFQAPEFYEGLGYQAAGRWDGYPSGHSQVFLEKSL